MLPLGDVIRQCDRILEQSKALDATSIPEMRNTDVFIQHVNVETHKPTNDTILYLRTVFMLHLNHFAGTPQFHSMYFYVQRLEFSTGHHPDFLT